ncbi:hypothetical protein Nocox_33345 [Nonomuraea coxensis DSM 45129]|uniref:Uncharacterized protein n=1 Tax=Nonomuraea coxensis DSM 45129 TaxID=1122611 RepID=A0ABX8U910_9ACTN|nr:hypothetical protein [Nonomuraea coxensis]QYC44239.1 hypothetical protein Nocox_33345 [Nonomuraea coxensis DSM 45129]
MTPLGLSSGSLPHATAADLAAAVLGHGGSGLDLRIGKGHAWERDGVERGLRAIAAAGAEVFFTGVGARLGDPAAELAEAPPAWPVKVFCVERPDPGLVAEQAAGRELWVETHAGGPDVTTLIDLAERTGVGLVLDVLGLAEIGGADRHRLAALAPHVRAAQVKGFHRTPQGTRHRPLEPRDLEPVLAVMERTSLRCVTVESRAGNPGADLVLLATLLKENT